MRRSLCIVLAGVAGLSAQQPPVFKSLVDAVRVDVFVSRGAKPVAGLTTADFELRDSGVAQRIEALALEDVPLHLLLALDTSSSMRGEPLQHLKGAAHAAIGALGPNDRAALLTFSHAIQRRIPFSGDLASINQAVDLVEATGGTALNDAAYAAFGQRESVDGRMLVLLFTDGFDTMSWLSPLAVIDEARRSDVVVDAVRLEPIGEGIPPLRVRGGSVPVFPGEVRKWFFEEPTLFRREFLPALADETGGELVIVRGSRDLRSVFLNIVAAFKSRYVLTYAPTGVPPSGWHPIEVRLKNKKGDIRARRGYQR